MEWEMVAGLEIHARVKSKSKMFCSCSNDTFAAEPNTHVCPVCMGFPGALPTINAEAIELAMLTSLALGCRILPLSKFDRKSYFYPDLPSGFQISQFDEPMAEKGVVHFFVGEEEHSIRMNRLHVENDAGKLVHEEGQTMVDYNRAGSPLMEMVTEADFRSPEQIGAFLRELQKILRTVGSSDADMEKGMMRCDVNISLRPKGQEAFGTKTELKNMNSFSAIERAVVAEVKRQKEVLESGGEIIQQTRGWDDDKGVSKAQRNKEEAADYRYFPEPDLPPLTFTEERIAAKKAELPELPFAKMKRFLTDYKLPKDKAELLASDPILSQYFETATKESGAPEKTSNWILGDLMGALNASETKLEDCKLTGEHLGKMVKMIESGKISGKIGKEIFPELLETGADPEKIVTEKGLAQVSDTGALTEACMKVIEANPQIVEQIRGGKDKAIGALVGQVMKETKGQANPQMVQEILRKMMNEE